MSAWEWHSQTLPAASAVLALLEADAAAVGQLMLSRPIVVGPALGAVVGRPWEGGLLGAAIELLTLSDKPLGSIVPFSAPVAAGAAVLFASGPNGVPMEAALPAGLLLGAAHARVESRVRSSRAGLCRDLRARVREGRPAGWGAALGWSLGLQLGSTAGFAWSALALAGPAVAWAWSACPGFLKSGLAAAWDWTPWLGAAALLQALARRA